MTKVTNPGEEPEQNKISSTIQDYLSLLYVMERDNEPVVGSRLAELLGVTPPTVTNTLKRMTRDGLITHDRPRHAPLPSGWDAARVVMRRHMLMEWMMFKTLPWSKLHGEAHQLEHAISAMTETALMEQLGNPQTCPHGNPLPGFEQVVAGWPPLTAIPRRRHGGHPPHPRTGRGKYRAIVVFGREGGYARAAGDRDGGAGFQPDHHPGRAGEARDPGLRCGAVCLCRIERWVISVLGR